MAAKKIKIVLSSGKEIGSLTKEVIEKIADCAYCKLEPVLNDKKEITAYTLVDGALQYKVLNEDGSSDYELPVSELLNTELYTPVTVYDENTLKTTVQGFKLVTVPGGAETTGSNPPAVNPPVQKPPVPVKHVHTFKFTFQQFVRVETNSDNEKEALEAAKIALMNEYFDAKRHCRYDGCKK